MAPQIGPNDAPTMVKNEIRLAATPVIASKTPMAAPIIVEATRGTAGIMVAKLLPGTDPVHKVSIIPRGMALGVTLQLPTADRYSYDREHLLNNIAILLGGRAAEEIALQHMTTGAGNDIERATALARKMVTEWGMSDKLGPLAYGKKEEQIFLGREIAQHRDYSEHTAIEIDEEVKRIVSENYEKAKKMISERRETLDRLTKALLEKETLDGSEIEAIVNGQPAAA